MTYSTAAPLLRSPAYKPMQLERWCLRCGGMRLCEMRKSSVRGARGKNAVCLSCWLEDDLFRPISCRVCFAPYTIERGCQCPIRSLLPS